MSSSRESRSTFGVLFFSRLQPYLKRFRGTDILRQLSIVESEDHFVVNEHIRTTGLVLGIFNFPHQPLIVVIKAQFAVEFAANECLANKEFAESFGSCLAKDTRRC